MGGYDTPMPEGFLVREPAVKWGYTVLNVEKKYEKVIEGEIKRKSIWKNIFTGKSIDKFYKAEKPILFFLLVPSLK